MLAIGNSGNCSFVFTDIFAIIFAALAVIIKDGQRVTRLGFFHGYDSFIFFVALIQVGFHQQNCSMIRGLTCGFHSFTGVWWNHRCSDYQIRWQHIENIRDCHLHHPFLRPLLLSAGRFESGANIPAGHRHHLVCHVPLLRQRSRAATKQGTGTTFNK